MVSYPARWPVSIGAIALGVYTLMQCALVIVLSQWINRSALNAC